MGATAPAVSTPSQTKSFFMRTKTLVERALGRTYTCTMEYCGKKLKAKAARVPGIKTLYAYNRNTAPDANYPLNVNDIAGLAACQTCVDDPAYPYVTLPLLYVVEMMQRVTEENATRLIKQLEAAPPTPQSAPRTTAVVRTAMKPTTTTPLLLLPCSGCGDIIIESIALLPEVEVLYDTFHPGKNIAPPLTQEQLTDQVICKRCAGTVKTFSYRDTASLMERLRIKGLKWSRQVPGRKPEKTHKDRPSHRLQATVTTTATAPHVKPKGPAQAPRWDSDEKNCGTYVANNRKKGGSQQGNANKRRKK